MTNINYQSKRENLKSINSLLNSQSCILSTIKDLYCCDFTTELITNDSISGDEKVLLLTQFMDLLSCKEESTTKLLNSICCFMDVDSQIKQD